MADDAVSKTKQKKAQRDAERKEKGKKRKAAALEEPLPAANTAELEQDFVPLEPPSQPSADTTNPKPSKKRKRKGGDEDGAARAPPTKKAQSTPGETESATKSRFIVFVGNLPYSATDDTIREHFKSLSPFTLRHRTDPKTNKSKGFAFLEFENYDRMKTCLKLFHHSLFEEVKKGKRGDTGGRKINVELTAGGGGKTDARKEKIRVKNERLEEQRKRRIEQEKKEKARKERKNGDKTGGGAEEVEEQKNEPGGESLFGVHPSRLARMQN